MLRKIDLAELASSLPRGGLADAAAVDGVAVRIGALKGSFPFHVHADEDELFVVLSGRTSVETQDGRVDLAAGEALLVPRGTAHRTVTPEAALVLFIHPDRIALPGAANAAN